GLAVHYGGGKKISESRPCRLLAAVSDHLGGGEWEALASLLRHPDFERWAADQAGPSLDAGRPVELARLFARHLPGRPGGPRRARGGGGTRIDALVEAIAHSAPMQGLVDPRSRPLGEWAAPILAFLAEV